MGQGRLVFAQVTWPGLRLRLARRQGWAELRKLWARPSQAHVRSSPSLSPSRESEGPRAVSVLPVDGAGDSSSFHSLQSAVVPGPPPHSPWGQTGQREVQTRLPVRCALLEL